MYSHSGTACDVYLRRSGVPRRAPPAHVMPLACPGKMRHHQCSATRHQALSRRFVVRVRWARCRRRARRSCSCGRGATRRPSQPACSVTGRTSGRRRRLPTLLRSSGETSPGAAGSARCGRCSPGPSSSPCLCSCCRSSPSSSRSSTSRATPSRTAPSAISHRASSTSPSSPVSCHQSAVPSRLVCLLIAL